MKFGESVIFVENGVEHNAIVIASRILDDHLGKEDEPLLDIAFFKEVMMPGPKGKMVPKKVIGTSQQIDLVQFRVDVVHDSHEYDEDQSQKYGSREYKGGRWKHSPRSTFTGRQVVGKKEQ